MPKTTDYVSTLFDNDNNPSKVTIALTMAGKALEKGHSATIILMVDGVRLALPNAFDKIDIGAAQTHGLRDTKTVSKHHHE